MDDFVTTTVNRLDYLGIALLMALENLVPPIPSEVVMPAAGFAARQGELSYVGVVIAGTVGAVIGALPWYGAALWLGEVRLRRWIERRGRWLGVSGKEFERSLRWFDRWGVWAVTLGRLAPAVRTLISVPAGLARMNLVRFMICTMLGTVAWNAGLAGVGWHVGGNYNRVSNYIGWAGAVIVGLIVIWLGKRIWSVYRRRTAAQWNRQDA